MQRAYETTDRDRRIFGDDYDPPDQFEHGKFYVVVRIPKLGDGHDVEIEECRMPARFYRLRILGNREWVLSTGSGQEMARLVIWIATAVASGMLGFGERE